MNNHLSVFNLSLTIEKTDVLKDVSFSLEEGKIYGLLGRNGAGKTSLLSIISGLRNSETGSVHFNDKPLFEDAKAMESIGFYYQVSEMHEAMNAQKIAMLIDQTDAFRPSFDKTYALRLMKTFKLPIKKRVNQLSKGMQSTVWAVMGLASRLPITIFDEVYLGMDAPTRNKFYQELLEDHSKHPRTIILSTHLVAEMDHLFEKILVLDKGTLIVDEPYEELIEQGITLTGSAGTVDAFVQNYDVLNEQLLGPTKSVAIYKKLDQEIKEDAVRKGLQLGRVSLQDLFIYMTEEDNDESVN